MLRRYRVPSSHSHTPRGERCSLPPRCVRPMKSSGRLRRTTAQSSSLPSMHHAEHDAWPRRLFTSHTKEHIHVHSTYDGCARANEGTGSSPGDASISAETETREMVQPLVMMVYRSPLHSLTLQVQPSGGPKRSQPNQTVPAQPPCILTPSPCALLFLGLCVGTV
jgi:hypothetical protein